MPPLSEWQTLFSTQASAAATLTGLVFVAASINLTKIIEVPGLAGRTAESILHFMQVFFACSATLIPRQSATALAIEILSVAGLSWLLQGLWQIRYARLRTGHPRRWLTSRILQTHLGTVPIFIAGIGLLLGMETCFYWLALGFALSFVAGVANAWILLIEIMR